MKRKTLFIVFVLSTILFSNCKKKNDPAPTPAPIITNPVTPPTNTTNTNGTLTIGSTVHTYSVAVSQGASYYKLNGSSSSNSYPTFTANFVKGIPTTTHDIDISNQDELSLGFYGPNSYYNAKKGIVKVTVSGTDVRIDFTDVTFTPEDLVASGHMSSK